MKGVFFLFWEQNNSKMKERREQRMNGEVRQLRVEQTPWMPVCLYKSRKVAICGAKVRSVYDWMITADATREGRARKRHKMRFCSCFTHALILRMFLAVKPVSTTNTVLEISSSKAEKWRQLFVNMSRTTNIRDDPVRQDQAQDSEDICREKQRSRDHG